MDTSFLVPVGQGFFSTVALVIQAVPIRSVFQAELLLGELTTWLYTLTPIATVLMIVYHALMRNLAQDENAASQHTKSIRNVITGCILALGAGGLVNFLTHFVDPCAVKNRVGQTALVCGAQPTPTSSQPIGPGALRRLEREQEQAAQNASSSDWLKTAAELCPPDNANPYQTLMCRQDAVAAGLLPPEAVSPFGVGAQNRSTDTTQTQQPKPTNVLQLDTSDIDLAEASKICPPNNANPYATAKCIQDAKNSGRLQPKS